MSSTVEYIYNFTYIAWSEVDNSDFQAMFAGVYGLAEQLEEWFFSILDLFIAAESDFRGWDYSCFESLHLGIDPDTDFFQGIYLACIFYLAH